jgi:peptide chain release factor 1
MFENLDGVERRFNEIEDALASGALKAADMTRVSKERASLEELVTTYRSFKRLKADLEEAKALLAGESDAEMRALAKDEVDRLEQDIASTEKHLIVLSLPKDPNDQKNVILEIRAGTGGEEAALFAADLFRMYQRYADRQRWKVEILSTSPSATGGLKEIICMIEGQAVFSRLKFESGVHRVQRVPATESQGRIHTSACTVAILPEADDIEVDLKESDVEVTVCRSSGAGGQHVNTTDSAVRLVHKPTGVVVECQDERSQHKNKDKAFKILKAKLYEKAVEDQASAMSADRRSQVGSGDRSERIRTYNFPQGRLTDHRINLTLYRLDSIMEGDIGEVLDALGTHHQTELLKRTADAGPGGQMMIGPG